ncbi:MAG: sodium-independent anion transporter [Acidimicrobiaceae bacterium]|nr:sodium-independent anion transporter [Acidimicrobiaceae bacterium]|tara:strand:+ start:7919 stop:9457 length:1539 start_codon:yes stop_codon:yes gene_type:complete
MKSKVSRTSLRLFSQFTKILHPKSNWFQNPKAEILSGLVVALALIPEAISFSIIAGVDPKVGLYASFSVAIIISFSGGRSGMISAATGAMALVVVSLVEEHGVSYLFAATILAGIIQIIFGRIGIGDLMKFIPRTVMIAFVNALAILIFLAQIPHILLSNQSDRGNLSMNLVFIGVGLFIIYLFPRFSKAIPSPLVAIVSVTLMAILFKIDLPTVGDMGELPNSLPGLSFPDVPLTFEMLKIIFPYSLTLALVGLLESLLTAQLLDDLTDTSSNKNMESRGQGLANVVTGFLGGMAGCAMVGQSIINYRSGGRARLSTLSSGVFLFILVIAFGDFVAKIPMPVLVAVMIMVSISTFDWSSIRPANLKAVPVTETAVMVTTVGTVLMTHNLAYGVGVGVLLSAVFFVRNLSRVVRVTISNSSSSTELRYLVTGELFFASVEGLVQDFNYDFIEGQKVKIDLSGARIWDTSAVVAIDTVLNKFLERGIETELVGLNRHAKRLHTKTTGRSSVGH